MIMNEIMFVHVRRLLKSIEPPNYELFIHVPGSFFLCIDLELMYKQIT